MKKELAEGMVKFIAPIREKAEAIRPPGNDDALLRWNTCARMIAKNKLVPEEEEKIEYPLE